MFGEICKPIPVVPLLNDGDDTAVKEKDLNQKFYTA